MGGAVETLPGAFEWDVQRHGIGYSSLIGHTGFHAVDGDNFLRTEGYCDVTPGFDGRGRGPGPTQISAG